MMEGTGDIYFISHLMSNPILTVFFCMYCAAVPRIPRPSDKQFLEYAQEGKTEQVAEALLHYPDLVNVQYWVSNLCSCDRTTSPPCVVV